MTRFGLKLPSVLWLACLASGALADSRCGRALALMGSEGVAGQSGNSVDQRELPQQVAKSRQDLRVLWDRLRDRVKDFPAKNPFVAAGVDLDAIGLVHRTLENSFAPYREIYQAFQAPKVSQEQFLSLAKTTAAAVTKMLAKPHAASVAVAGVLSENEKAVFAALESMRILSRVLPHVTLEETQSTEIAENTKKKPSPAPAPAPAKLNWRDKPPDRYRPENKELGSSGGSGPKTLQAWVDVQPRTPYLAEGHLDGFNASEGFALPEIRPQVRSPGRKVGTLGVRTDSAESFVLTPPVGFLPIAGDYPGFSVIAHGPDHFSIRPERAGEFEVPLFSVAEAPRRFESPNHLSGYTDKIGMRLEDWPEDYQVLVHDLKKSTHSREEVARRVEELIHSKDYFSVSEAVSAEKLEQYKEKYVAALRRWPKVLAMAHTGAFNCDGAAFQMAIVLREYFGIPARVGHGPTLGGKKNVDGVVRHLMFAEDPRHAWVEVWIENKGWVAFDPTPPHAVGGNQSQKMDYEQADFSDKPRPTVKPPDKSPSESPEKLPEKSHEAKESETEKPSTESAKPDEKEKKATGTERSKTSDAETVQPGAESALVKAQKNEAKPAIEKLSQVIEGYHLEQILEHGKGYEALRLVRGYINLSKNDQNQAARMAEQSLRALLRPHHEWSLTENLSRVGQALGETRLEDAYFLLRELGKDLTHLGQRQPLSVEHSLLKEKLRAVEKSIFAKFRRHDSADQTLVQTVFKNLPGNIGRKMLRDRYGAEVEQLGSVASSKLASDMRSGKLAHFLKMAALRDVVNMWLKPTMDRGYSYYSTFDKAPVATEDQIPLITRDFNDFSRWIIEITPGHSFFDKFFRGEQFAIGSTEQERERTPKLRDYSRLSVSLYDKSGSMSEMVDIQDALLSGLYSRALSERDLLGRPNHQVISAAFGSEVDVSSIRRIFSGDEAIAEIARLEATPTVANDGTDIQTAILWFFKQVDGTYQEKKSSREAFRLRNANLQLFTDGQSNVDLEVIRAARAALPKDVNIGFHFVAIGGRNEELETLAKELSGNKDHSSVTVLDAAAIQKVQYDAAHPIGDEEESFKSIATGSEAVAGLRAQVEQLQTKIPAFAQQTSPFGVRSQFERVGAGEPLKPTADIKPQALYDSMRFVGQASDLVNAPTELRLRLGKQVVENYGKFFSLARRDLDRLLEIEKEKLDYLRRWVLGEGGP